MGNSYSLNLENDLAELVNQSAKILDLSMEEAMEHLIRIGADTVLDKNFMTAEVSDEMFNDIERRLSPKAHDPFEIPLYLREGIKRAALKLHIPMIEFVATSVDRAIDMVEHSPASFYKEEVSAETYEAIEALLKDQTKKMEAKK